jgi:ABC-type multidrug transport system ATPase subunit
MNDFLNEPELGRFSKTHGSEYNTSNSVIGFHNGIFTYYGTPDNNTNSSTFPESVDRSSLSESGHHSFYLRNINIEFPIGKVTAIIGPTGSGKTSLLVSLLGEMKNISGSYSIPETNIFQDPPERKSEICYVSQTAWLMNATIRDNILFGEEFVDQRYNKVIAACALLRDLENLESGDLTEIGEKGVNLSGGQKQRVALGIILLNIARAAYSMSPIVLLDDPLSAVDAPTAKHLFHQCILGLFKGRTVILVSHALSLVIPQSDYVVIMKNGEISSQGLPTEVSQNPLITFTNSSTEAFIYTDTVPNTGNIKRFGSTEGKSKGRVKWTTYNTYISACGGVIFIIGILMAFSFQVFADFLSNFWIGLWTDSIGQNGHKNSTIFEVNILKTVRHITFSTDNVFLSDSLFYISVFGLIGLVFLFNTRES